MQLVDRYQLLEALGQGGFGAVYRAQHVHTGEIVALKLLDREGAGGTVGPRVLREARALAGLVHPNVVRVLDCGVTPEGQVFVAMELAKGVELATLLEQGAMPPARAIDIACQMLAGLGAVHARGIVHRDVKPSNVVVGDVVRLIDFGISKITTEQHGDRTRSGMSMGTPGYMAPEQLGNAHASDARADLYAVAVVVYQMLSGALPHRAPSYEDYVVAVRTTQPPPLRAYAPHVSPALEAVVMQGLAIDPAHRFASADAFARALAPHAGASPSPSPSIESLAPTLQAPAAPSFGPTPAAMVREPATRTQRSGGAVGAGIVLGVLGAVVGALAIGAAAVWMLAARGERASVGAASDAGANGTARSATATATASPSATPSASARAAMAPDGGSGSAKKVTASAGAGAGAGKPSEAPCARASAGLAAVSANGNGVRVGPGHVVGSADVAWVDAVAKRSVGALAVCRPQCGAALVSVNLFLQPDGHLSLAAPSADNKGDASIARCVADRMKSAAPRHDPKLASSSTGAPHGIVTYEVWLEPAS